MRSDLPARPRLVDGLELVTGPGDNLQLRGCTPPVRLTGRMPRRLLPLLDGARSLDAITAALGEWPPEQVLAAIGMLAGQGLVGDAGAADAPPQARSQAAFYWAASTGPADRGEQTRQRLGEARIHLFGWGTLLQELERILRLSGCERLTVEAWSPPSGVLASSPGGVPFPHPEQFFQRFPPRMASDLVLLTLRRPAPALLDAANAACLSKGVPWLPVVVSGGEAVVGPAVLPGRSPCYTCFKHRLKTHAAHPEDDAAYEAHLDRAGDGVTVPEWPPLTAVTASLAAMEAIRLITQFAPASTTGQVIFMDGRTGSQRSSQVWKLPRCPACMGVRGGEEGGQDGG